MSDLLKGNYKIENFNPNQEKKEEKKIDAIFEEKALEKLGGSIAFVMKRDKFVWDDKDDAE
jgi:hypothetical protein